MELTLALTPFLASTLLRAVSILKDFSFLFTLRLISGKSFDVSMTARTNAICWLLKASLSTTCSTTPVDQRLCAAPSCCRVRRKLASALPVLSDQSSSQCRLIRPGILAGLQCRLKHSTVVTSLTLSDQVRGSEEVNRDQQDRLHLCSCNLWSESPC